MTRGLRVGVFGGTFDPPHIGHLAIAECARDQLRLDRVLFVPAAQPPHKRGREVTDVATRVAMTRLAVRGNKAFVVSSVEASRSGPSYTVDTLRALRRETPGARWWLLIGEDSLEEFHTWRDPEHIVRLATLAVARRSKGSRAFRRGPSAAWLDAPLLDVSSSDIRLRVSTGRSVRYLVTQAVTRYVTRRGLYLASTATAPSASSPPMRAK